MDGKGVKGTHPTLKPYSPHSTPPQRNRPPRPNLSLSITNLLAVLREEASFRRKEERQKKNVLCAARGRLAALGKAGTLIRSGKVLQPKTVLRGDHPDWRKRPGDCKLVIKKVASAVLERSRGLFSKGVLK